MDVKAASAPRTRPRTLAGLLGLVAILLVILACGGPAPVEMIPVATLEPNVPAFRVISLVVDRLQARNGRDGSLQWDTRVPPTGPAILTSDPTAHVIYISVTSSPMVIAVNADDGRILWQFSECTGPDDHILLGSGRLYLTCGQAAAVGLDDPALATLYALDARTGAVLWKDAERHARALVGANVIAQTPGGLAALDGATGAILWQHTVDIIAETPSTASYLNPIDAFQFVVRIGPTGALYYSPDGVHAEALRASDGTLLWRSDAVQDISSAPTSEFTQYASVALATTDEVVTQGVFGVTVLRASDGTILWRHYQYPDGGGITTLLGDDGALYVAKYYGPSSATRVPEYPLAAFNPNDGSVRWDVNGPAASHPLLVLDGDTLVAGEPGEVSAFRTSDGARLWRQTAIYVDSIAADSHVLCVQAGALLYVLKLADGLKVWKQTLPSSGRTTPLLLAA